MGGRTPHLITDESERRLRSYPESLEREGWTDGQVGRDRVRVDRRSVRGSGRKRDLRARRLDLRVRPWQRRRQVQARRAEGGRGAVARPGDLRGVRRGLAL